MQSLPIPIIQNQSFSQYVNTLPHHLPKDEELELIRLYQATNDYDIFVKIITHNLRFVAWCINTTPYANMTTTDVKIDAFQEGVISLIKSLFNFDLSYGVRLASFAVKNIKSAIKVYCLDNISEVKLITTKSLRVLYDNNSVYQNLIQNENGVSKIAEVLGVSEDDVIEYGVRRTAIYNEKVDECSDDESESSQNPNIKIENDKIFNEISEVQNKQILSKAISHLPSRNADIIKSFYFSEDTLTSLAEKYKISIERIRQIKNESLELIKTYIMENGGYNETC